MKQGPSLPWFVPDNTYHLTGVGRANRCTEEIIIIEPLAVSVMRHWPDVWRDMGIEQVNAPVSHAKHNGDSSTDH